MPSKTQPIEASSNHDDWVLMIASTTASPARVNGTLNQAARTVNGQNGPALVCTDPRLGM
jgi:hypothetical protein